MSDPNLNQSLLELVQAAQAHPSKSRERRKILSQLLRKLRSSGQLTHPKRGQFQGFYNDIYEDALQRLFIYVCERIDNYNPARGSVLAWANFLLGQRFFIEASREFMATVYKGMDARMIKKITVEDLDRELPSDNESTLESSLSDDLKSYIHEDPRGVFQSTHVDNHIRVNFQWIALQRLDGYAWRELSEQTNVPVPTLSSFYRRCIQKFIPIIRQDLD